MHRIATIGFFDGVHKGHQFLFEQLVLAAQQRGLEPMVITFLQHPQTVLQNGYTPQLLATPDERLSLIHSALHLSSSSAIHPFNFSEIQNLTAQQFMSLLRDQFDVRALLMGYDHRFGSDRLDRPEQYQTIGQELGIEVIILPEFQDGEEHISSTEIRRALLNGHIEQAYQWLGRPYSLSGIVVHGNGIGRTIGFPTANLQPSDPYKLIPKPGVYATEVAIANHKSANTPTQMAITNIGNNPTVGNNHLTIEVHFLNFDGDLYGQTLTLSFMHFIRDERHFSNLQALRQQITSDLHYFCN